MKDFIRKYLKILLSAIVLIAAFVFFAELWAKDDKATTDLWPRKITEGTNEVVIYQPQLDSYSDVKIEARSALSVKTKDLKEPIFGAIWFTSDIAVNKEQRIVTYNNVKVTAMKFPDITEEQKKNLTAFIEKAIVSWDKTISYDRFVSSLETLDKQQAEVAKIKNDPPDIIFKTKPTMLISIDGEPKLQQIEKSELKYVVNTPFTIINDPVSAMFYLKGNNLWYESKDVKTGWKNIKNPPKNVQDITKNEQADKEAKAQDKNEKNIIPEILVVTKPTELLQSEGEPKMSSLKGTELLYLSNSENDIVFDVKSQEYFIVISGRWYKSKSLQSGPWAFVDPTKLPEEFKKIPEGSEVAQLRNNIPGTTEAKEAVLENDIPQTAEVDRTKPVTIEVKYDGEPKFEPVEGTGMKYAVNTDKAVFMANSKYYLCEKAVWYVAPGPKGPWEVSTVVPQDITSLPPSNPNYNVKYVYIYDTSPTVVYIGYTPGYTYSYTYNGVVVYGTGYYYTSWYGAYYYPRPVTYGYSVHYNPYTGWGFSYGMSVGWMTPYPYRPPYYHGYWGPAGYHAGYRHGYYHGYNHGYAHGAQAGYRAGYRAGQASGSHQNMYKNNPNARVSQRPANVSNQPANRASTKPANMNNNVYADKNGDVFQKTDKGWQQRENNSWQNVDKGNSPSTMDKGANKQPSVDNNMSNRSSASQQPSANNNMSNRSSMSQPSTSNLNKDSQARDRGATRQSNASSYNRSSSYGGGGSRGGGGGRGRR